MPSDYPTTTPFPQSAFGSAPYPPPPSAYDGPLLGASQSEPSGPRSAWDGMCNQEKFEWLKARLEAVQLEFVQEASARYDFKASFRDHRPAPEGTVMVQNS